MNGHKYTGDGINEKTGGHDDRRLYAMHIANQANPLRNLFINAEDNICGEGDRLGNFD